MRLDDAVIKLHEVAGLIEQQIGIGQLSADVRHCADQLNDLLKPVPVKTAESYDPTIQKGRCLYRHSLWYATKKQSPQR